MMESLINTYIQDAQTHANSLTLLILFKPVLNYSHFQNPTLIPLGLPSSSSTATNASFTLLAFPNHFLITKADLLYSIPSAITKQLFLARASHFRNPSIGFQNVILL